MVLVGNALKRIQLGCAAFAYLLWDGGLLVDDVLDYVHSLGVYLSSGLSAFS